MAISYPLTIPNGNDIKNQTFRQMNVISVSASPFTLEETIYEWSGQAWEGEITLRSMNREMAEPWVAFLMALKGQTGSFNLGDQTAATARGTPTGTPVVDGANQIGDELAIGGATPNVTGWLKAGDYIQLGSGLTATLHKQLVDVDTDASGTCTLDIWPSIRVAPTDGDTVVVSNPVGLWRLSDSGMEWTVKQVMYGITFPIREAV